MRSSLAFIACSYLAIHSCSGARRAASSRYSRRRPCARHRTRPTSLSTRRCFDTWGWDIERSFTIVPTAFSPAIKASRMSRRSSSAIALKTSDVVDALATPSTYSTIGICQDRLTTRVGVGLFGEDLAIGVQAAERHQRADLTLHAEHSADLPVELLVGQ